MKYNPAQDRQAQDKKSVVEWFQKYAHGFRSARTRKDILPFIFTYRTFASNEAKDRYFREIASELIKEGALASSNTRGYWFIPIHTRDRKEVDAVIACHLERRAKALTLIEDCNRIIDEYEQRKGGQMEFSEVEKCV